MYRAASPPPPPHQRCDQPAPPDWPRSMRPQLWRLPAFPHRYRRICMRAHRWAGRALFGGPVCLAQISSSAGAAIGGSLAPSDQVRRGHTREPILGAVSTPSPPPSGHLLRGGSDRTASRMTHVPGWGCHREINDKGSSHGWREEGFTGSSPALLDLSSRPCLPICPPRYLPSVIVRHFW